MEGAVQVSKQAVRHVYGLNLQHRFTNFIRDYGTRLSWHGYFPIKDGKEIFSCSSAEVGLGAELKFSVPLHDFVCGPCPVEMFPRWVFALQPSSAITPVCIQPTIQAQPFPQKPPPSEGVVFSVSHECGLTVPTSPPWPLSYLVEFNSLPHLFKLMIEALSKSWKKGQMDSSWKCTVP